jgi:hypothetical protein
VAHNKPVFTIHRLNFKDVVVWNPYTEGAASMGDFEPKSGWKNMVPRFTYRVLRIDLCRGRERGGLDDDSGWWSVEGETGNPSTSLGGSKSLHFVPHFNR